MGCSRGILMLDRRWKKYTQFILIGFKEASAYRLNAIMSFVNAILFLILAFAIWSAIAAAGELEGGLSTVMIYLVLGQVTSRTIFQSVEQEIGEDIRDGDIVNELKRPLSLRWQVYCSVLGRAIFSGLSVGIPMFLIGTYFLDLQFPGAAQFGAYLISLFLAFNLVFMLSYVTSMLIFWTKVAWSIRYMRQTVQELFSGVLFPLYLLPSWIAPVFAVLPFQAMVDTPITIYMGEATGTALLSAYGQQLAWIIALFVLGELMYKRAKTRLTVQGG